ncbi:toxic anion resistance protein [Nocardioides cavernaquae]|uniref:Toxic anion resistance protein n=1 Tax=Nocardioides cavernaquae TaxID=2321396 RepID=A0A3A5H987_9ACTN|nr:toxic anion resistance protein [Nocardioides cavernaquae]RJS46942.1 hypothetical protein D4739_12435 [Nocardioides cavernaquae]
MSNATPTPPALPGVNFKELLGAPESNPEPATALESALAKVTPEDAAAAAPSEATFQFRSLLTDEQRADLERNAPGVAAQMVGDFQAIIRFGEPVLTKLNASSTQLLAAQRDIKVPPAEDMVNDLLREMDGFQKKYRNEKVESAVRKVVDFIRGATYSLKTLVREAKPISDKIDIAETKLKEMELRLADNVTRGQQLHKNTVETLQDVVAVLAALEQINEVVRADFAAADEALKGAEVLGDMGSVQFQDRTMTVNELRELHGQLATASSEIEKTWFDWRQQFFLGYAQAPSIRNLILVSATMQRRCQVFRTMGLPSARTSLAMWQQAALAQEGAEMGSAVQKGTNDLVKGAFEATGKAVTETARASQTPLIDEDTIWSIIESIKVQCDGLVAADKWGREVRARNLKALEQGEGTIRTTFTESRRQLVANAVAATSSSSVEAAPLPEKDILGALGVES